MERERRRWYREIVKSRGGRGRESKVQGAVGGESKGESGGIERENKENGVVYRERD